MNSSGLRVACIGECMVELAPAVSPGERPLYQQGFAGDTYNTAVYFARQPTVAETHYVSAVGDDHLSDLMLTEMQRRSIGVGRVIRRQDKTVGLYLIEVDDAGERGFHYWRGDSAARTLLDDRPPALLLGNLAPDLIYVSGISLAILPEAARSSLMDYLGSAHAKVAFDPNYRAALWPNRNTAQVVMDTMAARADYVLTSRDDDRILWDLDTPDEALMKWRATSDAEIVIKQGPEPVWISVKDQSLEQVQPGAIAHPVDTTGAGDAFNAVYLAARLSGTNPATSAQQAIDLCRQVVMCRGAILDP